MIVVQHPTFPKVVQSVEDADVARWEAAGWVRFVDGARAERIAEVSEGDSNAIAATLCPTCGAVGDDECVTASGKPTSRHTGRPAA